MQKRWLSVVRIFAFCTVFVALVGQALSQAPQLLHSKRRVGTVLYQVKEGASQAQRTALQLALRSAGLQTDRQLRHGAVRACALQRGGLSEEMLALRLMKTGAVDWAEPDYEAEAVGLSSDPLFAQQWWHWDVHSPAAWDTSTGLTNLIVAVCDTGVQAAHPDLAANLVLPGYNTYLNNTYVEDTVGHGTMVAGIVGAPGDNGLGLAGMAWKIKLLPIRITYADGVGSAYISDMAEGLSYAADHGAKVINCSFSGYSSSTIETAAKYARGKGAVVCFAAGNSALDLSVGYLDSTNIIVVGATTAADTLATWSNYGLPIDLVAPGENITTTYLGSSYATGSGTSFASPVVAGLAALIFSVNPGLAPADVERVLKSTTRDLGVAGDDKLYGAGLVQADAAVLLAGKIVVTPTGLAASAVLKTVTVKWTDRANNETGYYVERATKTKTTYGPFTRVATLAANSSSFSQTVASGSYAYRVQAFNSTTGVTSDYSATATISVK